MKPRVGRFWPEVSNIKTLDGRNRFSMLCHLIFGLLSIPCFNADSERGFSIPRKIHNPILEILFLKGHGLEGVYSWGVSRGMAYVEKVGNYVTSVDTTVMWVWSVCTGFTCSITLKSKECTQQRIQHVAIQRSN